MTHDKFSNLIKYGIDAKLLQYEENATEICHDVIEVKESINKIIKGSIDTNCILINLEHDVKRYHSAVKELRKLSIDNFIHLKGTYWVNKLGLVSDLNNIINFLRLFNCAIPSNPVSMNSFSELSDPNIEIQDGPLACYCSHLRAWIYAYYHMKDYVLIVEDDLAVVNTQKIESYISNVDEDWDVICFNSAPKNMIYDKPCYRFIEPFHSTHCYMIRHASLVKLFATMYPIVDQVDVLISNRIGDLKIYNIPDTVYQKNWSTNTQNNLHVIFNSPNYAILRTHIEKVYEGCQYYADTILPENKTSNKTIVEALMNDVIFDYVVRESPNSSANNLENYDFDDTVYFNDDNYIELLKSVEIFLNCVKKGIKPIVEARLLTGIMLYTLLKFKMHNTEYMSHMLKAYGFGSTAHVYKSADDAIIVKKYNDLLRWSSEGHDDNNVIYIKERDILNNLNNSSIAPLLISYDDSDKILVMTYEGVSLYDDFRLPLDWRGQIVEIFGKLANYGINYPEFRLQNIVILKGRIKFVDYGLANEKIIDSGINCDKFIMHLTRLNDRLQNISDIRERHRLIHAYNRNNGL